MDKRPARRTPDAPGRRPCVAHRRRDPARRHRSPPPSLPAAATAARGAQPGALQTFDIPARPIHASGGAIEPLDVSLDDVAHRRRRLACRSRGATRGRCRRRCRRSRRLRPRPTPGQGCRQGQGGRNGEGRGKADGRSPASRPYKGRNHFWFPSLGINQAVYWFPCSRSKAPGNVGLPLGLCGLEQRLPDGPRLRQVLPALQGLQERTPQEGHARRLRRPERPHALLPAELLQGRRAGWRRGLGVRLAVA